jgi:hypothetical protein
MKLHLGVVDVPYSQAPSPRQRKARAGTVTTGDVAGWLENHYGLFQGFFDANAAEIADGLAESVRGTLESVLMGAPPMIDPFGTGISAIENRFRQFLSTKEAERIGLPGVPTQAALRGVSRRFKQPYRRRAPRPSFIDTGLLQASFKAWIE